MNITLEILSLGYYIGLHFDSSFYNIKKGIALEKKIPDNEIWFGIPAKKTQKHND
jgi:hypothetical protein